MQKIGAAQKIAHGKVDLALNLIGYDDEVTAAMDFVFGSTFICDDADTAKRVTFDPAVRMRSVTLEGDLYDPAGQLSGGSSLQSSGVLVTLQKHKELTRELEKEEQSLKSLQDTMDREKKELDAARKTKQELDLKNHEIKLTEEQISGNASSSVRLHVYLAKDSADHSIDHSGRGRNEGRHHTIEEGYCRCQVPP
jgi:structural maintenance of chromosome 2